MVHLTSTGYAANLLALPAVCKKGKTVFIADERSHNSMFVSMFVAQARSCTRFKHNDLGSLEAKLLEWQAKGAEHIVVCTEGMFSSVRCRHFAEER